MTATRILAGCFTGGLGTGCWKLALATAGFSYLVSGGLGQPSQPLGDKTSQRLTDLSPPLPPQRQRLENRDEQVNSPPLQTSAMLDSFLTGTGEHN